MGYSRWLSRQRGRNEALGTLKRFMANGDCNAAPAGCQTAHPSIIVREALYYLRKTQ